MDGPDTDTLLAMVTSLLENTSYDHEVILDALIQCDGDVARAARALNTGKLVQRDVSSGQGRTTVGQGPSLDRWLKQTSPGKPPDRIAQRPRPTKRQRSLSPAKPTRASPKIPQLASVVQKPRSASASALQTANTAINYADFYGTYVFVPVVDGTFIVERPTVTLEKRRVNGVSASSSLRT